MSKTTKLHGIEIGKTYWVGCAGQHETFTVTGFDRIYKGEDDPRTGRLGVIGERHDKNGSYPSWDYLDHLGSETTKTEHKS